MVNIYAAMPSMHMAWSIIAGALLISAFKGRWWAWALGVVHPVLMGIAVIVTANHFLLDVVVGVLALLGALLLLDFGARILTGSRMRTGAVND
jgi:membrane-associated phospholipid phosphatase